ncbi:hypothetical protein Tco_0895265 [Tanacetum coccineum]|uniref:Uncharacterized protein n=1 Tax=Tanacetum coccineum TaxID=301880 RepID=A0ABQ5CFB2_9ASTR
MLSSEATRYINNTSPLIGALLCILKKGRDFSAPFVENRLSAASFPLRLYTSLSVLGGSRSVPALNFKGLALIPCLHILFGGTLDHHVVNVGLKISSNFIAEYLFHQSSIVHAKTSALDLKRSYNLSLKFAGSCFPMITDAVVGNRLARLDQDLTEIASPNPVALSHL